MANRSFVVQYIIKAREQYAAVAEKVRASTSRMKAEIKSATVAAKQFSDRTKDMAAKARNWGLAITAVGGVTYTYLKNAARDAGEVRSKFGTVFKGVAADAESMSNSLAKNFGLSGTQARQLLGDTGDLLSGFGFTQKSALELSGQVNRLAVDLASFTNFSGGAEGASEALTKALLGERESLKSLGIAIMEKDVLAEVSKMLAEGQTFASMRQAKAQATLRLAIGQSKNAIGDFARTQGDLANQERITAARMKDLKESFGRLLLPIALKATKAVRGIAEWLNELSPGAKKAIVVVVALVAALGPILLVFGSLLLMWPALITGFASFGAVAAAALGPLGVMAAALALAAVVVLRNWGKVKAFFKGFADGLRTTLGPTVSRLVEDFREAAKVIAGLFGADSEAYESLNEFSNLGELIGQVIGGTLDVIIRGLSGIGAIIGQLIGAIATMDFSQFDVGAIKAEFLGANAEPMLVPGRVDVGVTVGLDKGLQQTSPYAVTSSNVRRTDTGAANP